MDLLARKSQSDFARQGSKLLKGKKEALLKEIMQMIPVLVETHADLLRAVSQASRSLAFAKARNGTRYIESISLAEHIGLQIKMDEELFWGVHIPKPLLLPRQDKYRGRTPLSAGMSAASKEVEMDFKRLLECIQRVIPLRIRLDRLGEEVKKTSRRVNALDQVLIPRLEKDIKMISQALEEREREDMFRLRRIKKKKEKQAALA
jgi:V/A-type H+-transporting ATPase subunit D